MAKQVIPQIQFENIYEFMRRQNNFCLFFIPDCGEGEWRRGWPVFHRFQRKYPALEKQVTESTLAAVRNRPEIPDSKKLPYGQLWEAYRAMSQMIFTTDKIDGKVIKPSERLLDVDLPWESEVNIREEIRQFDLGYKARHPTTFPDEGYHEYFGNYPFKLPFGGYRETALPKFFGLSLVSGGTKTVGEFFDDTDRAIETWRLDTDILRNLQPEAKMGNLAKRKEVIELGYRVFVALRDEGYSRRELTI